MRIYCPKCHMGYEVDENLIPEEGRRLRCGYCKEIFRFNRNGVSESENPQAAEPEPKVEESVAEPEAATPENTAAEAVPSIVAEETAEPVETEENSAIEMKDVFERLSAQSEKLFEAEQQLPRGKRFWLLFKTMLGLNRRFNLKLIILAVVAIGMVWLYNYRYEIVRAVPFMNGIYKVAGVRAKVPGEGLEFQNINWNYIDNNGSKVLEVKGFINNPTDREIEIPVVHVELLDKDTILLQSINQKPTVKSLKPDSRIAIGVIVKTPSPTAKYVYMTFIDVD